MDKVRLHRELLKRAWFSLPVDENKEEIREIVVSGRTDDYEVKIVTDIKAYYHSHSQCFPTLSEAIKFAKDKNKEEEYTKYKLVI